MTIEFNVNKISVVKRYFDFIEFEVKSFQI